jgi:NDP-sugar pyrophosphorylase family protein
MRTPSPKKEPIFPPYICDMDEACVILDCSPQYLKKLAKAGRIKSHVVRGHIFDREELKAFAKLPPRPAGRPPKEKSDDSE